MIQQLNTVPCRDEAPAAAPPRVVRPTPERTGESDGPASSAVFGEDVFSLAVMRDRLSSEVLSSLENTVKRGTPRGGAAAGASSRQGTVFNVGFCDTRINQRYGK